MPNPLPPPPPLMIQEWWREELANGINAGNKNQFIDAAGLLLGLFFVIEAWPRKKWINVLLGAVMVYVHGYRFFVADNVDPCDLCAASRLGTTPR